MQEERKSKINGKCASPVAQIVESACNVGDLDSTLGQEDLLEKEMAIHSHILAWKIPWM